MRIVVNIEVEIRDIKVDDRYYGFHYTIKSDDEVIAKGYYDSDHVQDRETMVEILKSGEAIKLALEQID
jgi:hypothetical protein